MSVEDHQLLDQIHQDALRVLEETGVHCTSPEIRQYFEVIAARHITHRALKDRKSSSSY